VLAVLLSLMLIAAACSSDDDGGGDDAGSDDTGGDTGEPIDYEAIGLWDDGPCDESLEPLLIGMITVFESPVLSLEDQALALEASVEAFNSRGGANGACIEVLTCDDGGNADQAMACARELDDAGVVVTVNDQVTAGQADVSPAMAEAGIPRVAANAVSDDWDDPNLYPMDASGTGVVFLLPQALIEEDVTEIAIARVDLAAASALVGLLEDAYAGDAEFPGDVPVPAGPTDFGQFVLAAQDGGAGGLMLAVGEQEAIQIVRAGEQLSTDMLIGASLGSFSQATVAELGDFAEQMVFLWSFPPATFDLPVYEALRSDMAASDEESLEPENLKTSPMRSWIGLYALLWMVRDTGMTDFTREGVTEMLQQATDVPMLDMFGGEDWTPSANHPGIYQRAGTDYWAVWGWDPDAEAPTDIEGNFVKGADISFDETLCGTIFGAPEPC
jgi:ABC-type branched-subunit amino acid transport system substrate-binding protein